MVELSLKLPIEDASIDYFDQVFMETLQFYHVEDLYDIFLAAHEAVINAVEQMKCVSLTDKYVQTTFRLDQEHVEVEVRDFGNGIPKEVWEGVRKSSFSDILLQESGRGLHFISAFMDEVEEFHSDDSHVLILKKRR